MAVSVVSRRASCSYLNVLLEARSWSGTKSFGFVFLAPALLIYFYAEQDRALAPFHRDGSPEEPYDESVHKSSIKVHNCFFLLHLTVRALRGPVTKYASAPFNKTSRFVCSRQYSEIMKCLTSNYSTRALL